MKTHPVNVPWRGKGEGGVGIGRGGRWGEVGGSGGIGRMWEKGITGGECIILRLFAHEQ